MKISLLLLILSLFTSSIAAFPHFFPNVSSIPPSLLPNTTAGAWDSFHKLSGCHSGQTVPGISKLKTYLHYFGYIGNASKNYTDDFDDGLESAVKNYQLNFNLNTTGELDEPTVNQILKPRCGVADIINGSSTMNSGKAASMVGHTVAHYSFFPGMPRWSSRRRDLTYAFDPRNQLSDDVKRVFGNAFTRWSEWTPLTFTESSNYDTADLKIGFYGGNHGDGEDFDGVLGTLAHAFAPPRGLLHLDSDETWIIDDVFASGSPSAMDLESVAVHEIGHLLGLGHSSIEEAVMFPTISSGVRKVELARDDVEGIQVLYGSNPDSNSTVGPTFGGRETSGAHIVSSLLVHVIFLAIGLALFIL
ncbi:metalloendoproteinase 5-MMP-like [Cynara cardunculus var. scolymus]|uniref:Peptidase metallopeptidase domain-containing protein n=1 Tax=Cynara cardunculus var. scolymus TaxID=59895 RepID=A0A103XVS5_CYNCS|nr:metalloendoproteinase 5-MMP-like [Cynara cardunculus var. scolymus]KVH97783.1 hypothetical protein Ccrd_000108 [Cynara cardunculus var. scolymus]